MKCTQCTILYVHYIIFRWQTLLFSLSLFVFLSVHLNHFSFTCKGGNVRLCPSVRVSMNAALWIIWNIHSITSFCQNPTLIRKSLWRDDWEGVEITLQGKYSEYIYLLNLLFFASFGASWYASSKINKWITLWVFIWSQNVTKWKL